MRNRLLSRLQTHLEAICAEFNVPFAPGMLDLQRPPEERLGDFAMNAAMRLAKPAKQPPIQIAKKIAERLATDTATFKKVEAVPPGFVNLYLTEEFVTAHLERMLADSAAAIRREGDPETVIVDYSSVNIAKQMHVGHLRSTIIGDVIARVLEARGEKVIRQNHLGDWGLPIAMVLMQARPMLREIESKRLDPAAVLTLAKLEEIYREATKLCAENPKADAEAHQILVGLQGGDPALLADWKTITRLSMIEVYRMYQLLGVTLTEEHERGESFYRDMLADTVKSIEGTGHLVESQGARCVFLDQFKTKDGKPLPIIVQKSDGGFNYETFDLAGIRYRLEKLRADRVIYVTDARQALHFQQVFALAEKIGWLNRDGRKVPLEHVTFGTVLGEDNKPLKTRSGESVKLADLLNEAIDRARMTVEEKNAGLPEDQKQAVSRLVGIGAVKYADLAQNRNNDYVFSFDRMLALTGNTAPYLQYAHARICSIFRKGQIEESAIKAKPVLAHPAERTLGLKLLQFPEAVAAVETELRPHLLCTYIYDLATAFTSFYDACPVLIAPTEAEKQSRLTLCRLTREVIGLGLGLLGIDAPREM